MFSTLSSLIVLPAEILYLLCLLFLSAMGFHRYRLCWLFLKNRSRAQACPPALPDSQLSSVTVQLPVYNEVYVVERVIEAVCAMDYPQHLIEIQVLDDSTDETSKIARAVVERKKSEGFRISHICRKTRRGYKGGALENGSFSASGEFMALFDADFVPPRDFLRRALGCFSDSSIGIVQARWGHINMNQSRLTNLQSIFLDGHLVVEQTGRSASGVFLNFNGTASVIRSSCLESSGGWHSDTLAEDLDLSCRAQLNGWKIRYVSDLICPSELPSDIGAFKSQQRRWTCGGVQNAFKFLAEIFSRKDLSAGFKTEAAFHMLGNFSSPFFLISLFSAVVVSAAGGKLPRFVYQFVGTAAFIATGGVLLFYLLAVINSAPREKIRRLAAAPFVMHLWAGISISNAREVVRCLTGGAREFVRTPKTAAGTGVSAADCAAAARFDFGALFELSVSLALLFFAFAGGVTDAFMRFLLAFFSLAFFYVSFLSLKPYLGRLARRS